MPQTHAGPRNALKQKENVFTEFGARGLWNTSHLEPVVHRDLGTSLSSHSPTRLEPSSKKTGRTSSGAATAAIETSRAAVALPFACLQSPRNSETALEGPTRAVVCATLATTSKTLYEKDSLA